MLNITGEFLNQSDIVIGMVSVVFSENEKLEQIPNFALICDVRYFK